MIGGKDWVDLAIVSAIALSVLSLMLGIQGAQHGRSRRQIAGTIALIWGTVALTLLLASQLESYWGGSLFDVWVGPEPKIVTRPVTGSQWALIGVMLVVILAACIGAIAAVRRLLAPTGVLADTPTVTMRDRAESDEQ